MNLREIEERYLAELKLQGGDVELIEALENSLKAPTKDDSVYIQIKTSGDKGVLSEVEHLISLLFESLEGINGVMGASAEIGDNGKYGFFNSIGEGFANIERKRKTGLIPAESSDIWDAKKYWEEWDGSVEDFKDSMVKRYKVAGRTVERWIRKWREEDNRQA
ncbi:hypothetical protein [Thiothrix sp.]|jgi:hypothetical protein|uniref:hypothetical protein n=1 Tax=Thiothrix sp. TaxID=1032 RepID=UPI00257DD24C|nr:hypothetical protein [Thiothrix sp.]